MATSPRSPRTFLLTATYDELLQCSPVRMKVCLRWAAKHDAVGIAVSELAATLPQPTEAMLSPEDLERLSPILIGFYKVFQKAMRRIAPHDILYVKRVLAAWARQVPPKLRRH